ncbi:MAG: hypothetical protein K8S99_09465 [Planctomycetes bacterium]|nr:hypothetical protein [Planctomycetota bacterium]
MDAIAPPELETLDRKPSWVNRAGRVDRSACVELLVGEVWRWAVMRRVRAADKIVEARGVAVVRASVLEASLRGRPPRVLVGDFRSAKSNAMSPGPGTRAGRWREKRLGNRTRASREVAPFELGGARVPPAAGLPRPGPYSECSEAKDRRDARPTGCSDISHGTTTGGAALFVVGGVGWRQRKRAAKERPGSAEERAVAAPGVEIGRDAGLRGNPNHGTTRWKVLGLNEGWEQAVVIERLRRHASLVRHEMLCPACGRRARVLLMPLATQAEVRDARTAAVWLNGVRQSPGNRPATPEETRLAARYGPVWDRVLKCASCWAVRYGENRKAAG